MAFSSAAGTASRESGFSSNIFPPSFFRTQQFQQFSQRIIKSIHDPLFQRNDSIVSDGDFFGADFGAALGDVAVTDAMSLFQFRQAILGIERMHLQRGRVNQEARADELIVLLMLTQHVAALLAKQTLNP